MKKHFCDLKSNATSVYKVLFLVSLLFSASFISDSKAQIFAPEGLNMPGQWQSNGFTNPPAVGSVFGGVQSAPGNGIQLLPSGKYQTKFEVSASAENDGGITRTWLFTSGPTGNPFGNKWGNVTVSPNTIQTYNNGGADNSATLTNNRWYTVNFENAGYGDNKAIFMETSAAPVAISTVTQSPLAGSVGATDPVIVTANLSAAASAEEIFYLRYSTNGFSSSTIVAMTGAAATRTATIPAQVAATAVSYYIFSSTVVSPATGDADLVAINTNTNSGSNYNYTVNAISNWNITFRVNMQNETVGGNVYLAGNFNGFSTSADPMTETAPGSGIYEITKSLAQGFAAQYKFTNGSTFEGNIGAPCGNGSNRTYSVGTSDATLPTVCFSSCNNCLPTVNVTFQVNMNNETVGGNVYWASSSNGYSTTADPMTETPLGSGIYTITKSLVQASVVFYKFTNGASFEGNLGAPCGNGSNRTYTVPASNATIPVACFSSCANCVVSGTWTSITSGNWNSATTWDLGTVPDPSADVIIASGHTVILNISTNIKSLTVNTGGTFNASDGAPRTLTIDADGFVTRNGTFNPTTNSKLVFGNNTTTNGILVLNDIDLNGGLTIAGSLTANGILQINAGGFFAGTTSPSYGPSSTLRYFTSGPYGRGLEWNAASGIGYPRDVQISNNTLLQPGGNSGQNIARSIAGNMTIDNGSAMFMDWGGLEMTQSITIGGNLVLNGSLSLSSQVGGDMTIGGSFTINSSAVFSANGRSMAFSGATAQQISGSALSLNFAFLTKNGNSTLTLNIPTTIQNDLFVSAGAMVSNADLTLQNGGTLNSLLTINSGRTLYVTGGTLNANGSLTLNSGASLMHGVGTTGGGGAVIGAARVKRTGQSTPAFNFWSSPVDAANAPIIGGQRYSYNPNLGTQSTVDDANEPGWVAATGIMNVGQGYASSNGGTVNFIGNLNNGAISSGVLSPALPSSKFNLVGNPYPSAISANAFLNANGPTGSNVITGSIYFWDDDNSGGSGYAISDYAVWNGAGSVGGGGNTPNGNIGSGQGFFVEANSSANIQFTNTMRTNNNTQFFELEPIRRVKLTLTNAHNESNETLIAFINDATEGRDGNYDATKLLGNPNIAFYSKMNGEALAIQGLPLSDNSRMIELGVIANRNEDHTISLSSLELVPSTTMIYLEDRETNQFINLRSQANYSFTIGTMDLENRFALHFSAPVEVSSVTASCDANTGTIEISNPSSELVTYNVYSNTNLVASTTNNNPTTEFSNLVAGSYILTMNFGTYTTSIQTEIGVAPSTLVNIVSSTNSIIVGESINFEAQSNAEITWFLNDLNTVVGSGNSLVLDNLEAGIYTILARADNGTCSSIVSTEVSVRSDNATGISSVNADAIQIAPNPSSDFVTIRLADASKMETVQVQLFDLAGKLVYTTQFTGTSTSLPVSGIDSGVYMLSITSKTAKSTSRLVIQ